MALVCKRFAALACSPPLLQHLQLPRVVGLPALQSLAAWLSRHGRHARMLEFDGWAGDGAAADSAVATCLAAVGAAGQLTKLQAVSSGATDWLAAMRSVRHLKLLSYTGVHVSATIAGVSTLQSLTLGGNSVRSPDGVRLPTSITRLFVEDGRSGRMPPQARRGGL